MAGFGNVWENYILNVIFGKDTWAVTTCWLTLATAQISDADTGSTISQPLSTNFARSKISTTAMSSAVTGTISNSAVISFVAAASNWGSITYFAVCDASVAGNVIAFGSLAQAQSILSGNTPYFDVSGLQVTLS